MTLLFSDFQVFLLSVDLTKYGGKVSYISTVQVFVPKLIFFLFFSTTDLVTVRRGKGGYLLEVGISKVKVIFNVVVHNLNITNDSLKT